LRRHRAVGGQVEQLCGDPWVGRAQQADVVDALGEHDQPVQAQAHRQPAGRRRQPGGGQYRGMGEPALPDLDLAAVGTDEDLPSGEGVRVRTGRRQPGLPGQHRLDDETDHRVQVVLGQDRSVGADAPEVHLVGFADVGSVDDVASVGDAGHAQDDLEGRHRRRLGGQPTQQGGDAGGGVRAQHPAVAQIAGVAPVARGGVR
jgi:hypothetical protein